MDCHQGESSPLTRRKLSELSVRVEAITKKSHLPTLETHTKPPDFPSVDGNRKGHSIKPTIFSASASHRRKEQGRNQSIYLQESNLPQYFLFPTVLIPQSSNIRLESSARVAAIPTTKGREGRT